AAMTAHEEDRRQVDEVVEALRRDLEAARYAAHRAWKQYDAVAPENRLVADELERRWDAALARVRDLELRIEQHGRAGDPAGVGSPMDYAGLAGDLDAVWRSPVSDSRLKKRIVRALIEEVIADVDISTSEVVLHVHWKGGLHTELRLP